MTKVKMRIRGKKLTKVGAFHIDEKELIVIGKLIKTARLREEWYEDVDDPESLIRALKMANTGADIFTFWQRIPETTPKYAYYQEWVDLAALPISDFDHWYKKQINFKVRNKIRKSDKRGVVIKGTPFNDQLVTGIMKIFNEVPVRRGKPFWHYNKDFDTVKKEMSADLECSIFIGAFYETELIGFIKLRCTERYAMITMILDLISHRDKAPINGLLAKAVEICAEHHIPYLTYVAWRRGSHGDFQRWNGFERIQIPRYYVPLTATGQLVLKLGFHRGFIGALPEKVMIGLLNLRAKWYSGKALY